MNTNKYIDYHLVLCIHYNKKIDISTRSTEIQPGDTEIYYCAGESQYSIIAFPSAQGVFDDAGMTLFATDFTSQIKDYMDYNGLTIEKYISHSELLDFHEAFNSDESGQWKMFSLNKKMNLENLYV